MEANPTLDAATFEVPASVNATYEATLDSWGEQTPQFFQIFTSLGIALDFRQNAPIAGMAETELAPGIFHLTGGSHHSLAVERENGIVIIEGPHSPERADAVIAWAKTKFPAKSITHVVATHHHEDHTAGLRSFVAEGAAVVAHEASATFYDEIFKRPSTIKPDALSQADPTPTPTIMNVDAANGLGPGRRDQPDPDPADDQPALQRHGHHLSAAKRRRQLRLRERSVQPRCY